MNYDERLFLYSFSNNLSASELENSPYKMSETQINPVLAPAHGNYPSPPPNLLLKKKKIKKEKGIDPEIIPHSKLEIMRQPKLFPRQQLMVSARYRRHGFMTLLCGAGFEPGSSLHLMMMIMFSRDAFLSDLATWRKLPQIYSSPLQLFLLSSFSFAAFTHFSSRQGLSVFGQWPG